MAKEEVKEEELKTEEAKAEEVKTEEAKTEETGAEEEPKKKEEPSIEEKYAELNDRYMRQLAEFDNYRKRTEKEKANMVDLGATMVIEKILGTIDNFERGLKDKEAEGFAAGMELTYKDFMKKLDDMGVKAIDCVGKEFDPNFHNAVLHEEDDSDEKNIVIEELQRGYTYKGSVVRYSMVKVKN